jgi:hypothetical protein
MIFHQHFTEWDVYSRLFGPSVEQNAPVWHQLIQKIEVRDVTG